MNQDWTNIIPSNLPAAHRKLHPGGNVGDVWTRVDDPEHCEWQAPSSGPGGAPAGTGYVHVTGGVYDVPAAITKSDVGLSNVDNTSDVNKPISSATQTALNGKDAAGAAAAAQAAAEAASDPVGSAAAAQSAAASDATSKVSAHDGLAGPHAAATSVGGKSIPSGGFADAGTLSTHTALTTAAHGGIVANTDARLTDARAPTLHAITDQTKHSSTATPGQILKADANGLPVNATNTDAAVAAAVTASHSNANDPTAAEKASFSYPLIFVPNSQRVFRSMTDVATGGFLTISGTAYFVYMGRVGPAAITPVAVRAYLRVLAATLTVAEAGIFSTPNPPSFAGQSVSKLAAVATWDSLTSGLGAKKSGALNTSVPAGTHLWAGFRAQYSTMPNFTGLIYDNRSGEILVTAGAAAFSTAGPWTGVLVAAQTAATPVACCPELMLTLD